MITDVLTSSRRNTFSRGALIVAILVVAAFLRLTGLNWDLAQWIHPDEGHMRMITAAVRWPDAPSDYFDTAVSTLNPRNADQTYSYGTLPLFATRALAEWLERGCALTTDLQPAPAGLNRWLAERLLTRLGQPVLRPCPTGTFTWTYSAFLGRTLSALADLGTVILVFVLGRRLYSRAVGLVAMALAAVTVLLIQQAHFYTVDSAATFFTLLTATFAVRAATRDRAPWLDLGLAGLSTGLAAACKVSAAVAAGLVALSALAWILRRIGSPATSPVRPEGVAAQRWRPAWQALVAIALPTLLSGALAFVAFRVAQPYAFDGPGFLGIHPNADWFGRLKQIGEEQDGLLDFPSGRQWTNRLPVVYPWLNIVLWGMGLPLGLAAWAGWGLAGFELARGRYWHLVPWTWTTLTFVFYATRWVKAMRYFLPVYPLLILFAAYGLARLHRHLRSGDRVRTGRVGTEDARGPEAFRAPDPWRAALGIAVPALVIAATAAWGTGFFAIYVRPHPRVAASRWIYDAIPGGSVIANEHWDWGLPLRIDGRDGYRGIGVDPAYGEITLELYNEDTPDKRSQLLDWLEQADYLVMASNRLYGSIARLPERYPLTLTYYRALFAGELGFELAGQFTSYIALGPIGFPDQETPFPLMAAQTATQGDLVPLALLPAEESFSVYDHPTCLIFRKTAAYSRARAEAILGAVDLSRVSIGLSPHEATPRAAVLAHGALFMLGLGLIGIVVLLAIRNTCPPASEL
ncbi:MAG: glycosyltransferase family 39 protein [Anaerolineae bacterium]|nr:glycosyltransferase family 39 protein [Anaerolineae bacterium]